MMMPVAVIYHCYQTRGWEYLLGRQLCRIVNAGISAPIYVSTRSDENFTLNWMLEVVLPTLPDGALLYLHTKGIVHGGHTIDDWREMMEYFCIDRWPDAMTKLDEGFDAVGCDWESSEPGMWSHFAGNFWWACTAHLRKLSPIIETDVRGHAEGLLNGHNTKGTSLHHSHVDHYREPYPRERYR